MTRKSLNTPVISALSMALLFAVCCAAATPPQTQEMCEFYLNTCPRQFDGDTILVPQNVIAMGNKVHGCPPDTSSSDSNNAASIMFVIDNSGSMKGPTGSDPNGSRFTVTRALLDTILKNQPHAEVGLIVFREHLFFDTTTSQYYTKYFSPLSPVLDSEPDQAYLPFLGLNQAYGGKAGIDIIKDILVTDSTGGDLAYQPNYRNIRPLVGAGETNINGAFEAVKQAFAKSKNPKSRQFVIFLSDGTPAGTAQAGLAPTYFEGGVNIPTTYTVFFTANGAAPPSLTTMTNNIKANGYSATNPKSNLWTIQTSHNALMALIMTNVMGTILSGAPSTMIVSNVSLSDTSTIFLNGYFIFSERFPLQSGITPFKLPLVYTYYDRLSGTVRDTTVTVGFYVKRVAGAVPNQPGVVDSCWTQTLQLYNNGTPVSVVTDTMKSLEVRFTPNDTAITSVRVTIYSGADSESVLLTKTGSYWTATIPTSSLAAIPNDGKLQPRGADSVVVVYRNPKFPLDTLRLSVPYVDNSGPSIRRAVLLPGIPAGSNDTLKITVNEPVNCQRLMSMPPDSIFRYFDAGTLSNAMLRGASFLGSCQGTTISEILVLVPHGQLSITAWQDSIAFVPGTPHVTDTLGIVPSLQTKKRVIESGPTTAIEIAVSPNPASSSKPIDLKIRQAYANVIGNSTYGALISIFSPIPLKQITVGSVTAYGKADIYDAVGNLAQTNLPVIATDKPGVYGVFWNLRNRNTRLVGFGTYLVMIDITDINNRKTTERVKVGVQR
jgi:hypothetical protein